MNVCVFWGMGLGGWGGVGKETSKQSLVLGCGVLAAGAKIIKKKRKEG